MIGALALGGGCRPDPCVTDDICANQDGMQGICLDAGFGDGVRYCAFPWPSCPWGWHWEKNLPEPLDHSACVVPALLPHPDGGVCDVPPDAASSPDASFPDASFPDAAGRTDGPTDDSFFDDGGPS